MRDTAPAFPVTASRSTWRTETGTSLLEAVIALGILLVLSLGLLPLGVVAVSTTENEGHLVARTTEYAQDKMEQLLALAYGDTVTDTRLFPSPSTGGTGLALGGSADPASPVAGYVDYLDVDGKLLVSTGTTPPVDWFYKRVWRITSPYTNMKQVTVTSIVARSIGRQGRVPQATVSALKTSPF